MGGIDAGLPQAEAARLFGVSESTIKRWCRSRHETGGVLAALTPEGIGPVLVLSGAVDSAIFTVSAERILAPRARPGQIVVLDNLSAQECRHPIGHRGHWVLAPLPAGLLPGRQPD